MMLGYVIAAVFGYVGGRIASSSRVAVRPAEASQYRIAVGGAFVGDVKRNGPTWAWTMGGFQSGAGVTATSALRQAVTAALANEADTGAPLDVLRVDGRLTANVFTSGSGDVWKWQIAFDGQPQQSGASSSRSLAAAAMLDKLDPYTER